MQHSVAPQKPFLVYYATGTAHAPHAAPKDWIAKYKGKFDQGWGQQREETLARQKQMGIVPADAKLTPRPDALPAWNSLSPDQKRLYSHMAEVYAAALSHADYNVGHVIDAIDHLESWTTRSSFTSWVTTAAAVKARCRVLPTK